MTEGIGPPPSKTAYVVSRLLEDIEQGAIAPGEPLRQADLATRYGVSATPVREALRLLESEGTITHSPHRGSVVAAMSLRRIEDGYRMRAAVESLATELAVLRQSEAELGTVKTLHLALAKAVRGRVEARELLRLNRELHSRIYESGSPVIARQIDGLWRSRHADANIWANREMANRLVRQHAQIMEAIQAGDASLAASRMAEHILTAMDFRLAEAKERGGA